MGRGDPDGGDYDKVITSLCVFISNLLYAREPVALGADASGFFAFAGEISVDILDKAIYNVIG